MIWDEDFVNSTQNTPVTKERINEFAYIYI